MMFFLFVVRLRRFSFLNRMSVRLLFPLPSPSALPRLFLSQIEFYVILLHIFEFIFTESIYSLLFPLLPLPNRPISPPFPPFFLISNQYFFQFPFVNLFRNLMSNSDASVKPAASKKLVRPSGPPPSQLLRQVPFALTNALNSPFAIQISEAYFQSTSFIRSNASSPSPVNFLSSSLRSLLLSLPILIALPPPFFPQAHPLPPGPDVSSLQRGRRSSSSLHSPLASLSGPPPSLLPLPTSPTVPPSSPSNPLILSISPSPYSSFSSPHTYRSRPSPSRSRSSPSVAWRLRRRNATGRRR